MSHMVTTELEIKDLGLLALAAEECGMELLRDQKTHRWYGRFMGDAPLPPGFKPEDLGKCEHALKVKGGDSRTYEVGVVRRRDGKPGWTLLHDYWHGGYGLEAAAGKGLSKLLQWYSAKVHEKALNRKGLRIAKAEFGADNRLRLFMRG